MKDIRFWGLILLLSVQVTALTCWIVCLIQRWREGGKAADEALRRFYEYDKSRREESISLADLVREGSKTRS